MPVLPWNSPAVIVLTAPPQPDRDALRSVVADAIVVEGPDAAQQAAAVATTRPDLPLIVLAEVDEAAALELLATADEVLSPRAALADVARAVRHAIARRAHRVESAPDDGAMEMPRAGAFEAASAGPDPATPQQLQVIGRLAAGLGHEFNNLLLVVGGNADLLRQRLPEGNHLKNAADAITEAGRRAAALTRQLLAFGRQQTLVPAAVDLNRMVTDAVPALRKTMGTFVRVVTDCGEDLPQVRVDAAQLHEVLANLAATALDAMPMGGTFTIATDTFTVRDEDRRGRPWLQTGEYVRLQVSDTGLGVEQDALPHLFEPFYAPRGSARNSGLVLSSVYGAVKQSGGYIWVESRVNHGTSVTILLPPIVSAVRRPRPSAPRPVPRARVLLVEDLHEVRDVLTNLLEMHEFEVLGAGSAEEALEVARTRAFDVLLTDVALPGQSGPELARQIRRGLPGTPVLFMSGHPANAIDPSDLEDSRGFLQKPFPSRVLVERLHELLGRPA